MISNTSIGAVSTDISLGQIDPLGLSPILEDTRQRFLRFKLFGENDSLLSLQDIVEVKQLSIADILPIPELKSSILGVCNWRGEILWLIDLNAFLGDRPLWAQVPQLEQPTTIVVQLAQRPIGLVVEQIEDIELIAPESIHNPNDLCPSALTPYVTGYLPDCKDMVLDAFAIVNSLFQEPP